MNKLLERVNQAIGAKRLNNISILTVDNCHIVSATPIYCSYRRLNHIHGLCIVPPRGCALDKCLSVLCMVARERECPRRMNYCIVSMMSRRPNRTGSHLSRLFKDVAHLNIFMMFITTKYRRRTTTFIHPVLFSRTKTDFTAINLTNFLLQQRSLTVKVPIAHQLLVNASLAINTRKLLFTAFALFKMICK